MKEYIKPKISELDIELDNVLVVSSSDENFDFDNGGFDEIWD